VNLADVTQALSNAFDDEFADEFPVRYENRVFDPPDGSAPWLGLTIVERLSEQATHGVAPNRRWQRTCAARVEVYTPPEGASAASTFGSGIKPTVDLAERVRRFFEGKSISGAKFRAASISTPTSDSDGRWVQRIVDCPFYFQERA
jgi:hypothetical protein